MKPSVESATVSKMQVSKHNFPWYFFWRTVRLYAAVILGIWLTLWYLHRESAIVVAPFMLAGLLVATILFYQSTKPLSRVLYRVSKIVSEDLPYGEQLQLFYSKSEWAQIEAALAEADARMQAQLKTIREENAKFTTLLESISNEILAIDGQQNVLFFNPRFERNFLARKEKLQLGGKVWSMLDIPEALQAFDEVLMTKSAKKIKGFSVVILGDTRFYNLTVSPLPIGGAVGVFTDVTESKLAEQMRVDFVANVSHEIRTPLTSIKGFSQLLKANQNQFPTELHGFIEKILYNTERMIALFNDLLQLSVIESRDKIKPEITSLGELIDHVEANVRTLYREKKPVITRELTVDQVTVDPKLFEQVLNNLVENACKYSPGQPEIKISTEARDGSLFLRIKDNGPGIGKEHLGRIFERFYRIDSSRDRETGGTGLGLSIVKHIVVKHHGKISALSDGQHGTEFVIELPA